MGRSPISRAHLGAIALALCSAACASTGAVPRPFPTPGPRSSPQASHPPEEGPTGLEPAVLGGSPDFYALVGSALDLRGTRYLDGGSDPAGFDCSGFTQYVFAQHGIALPRGVSEQFKTGREVRGDLAPGDLLFFTTTQPGASHVAIAVGGGRFVHAPSSSGVVRVESLSASYWSQRYLGARRLEDPTRP